MRIILLTDQYIKTDDTFIIGGWIQSLIHLLQESSTIELGVVGLIDTPSVREKNKNTSFYKINDRIPISPIKRIYNRFICKIQDENIIKEYINAIQDFQPDIVHIFGAENFLCNVIPYVKVKCVVHLQGLLNPYLNAFLPPNISINKLDTAAFSLFNLLRANSFRKNLETFRKKAERELDYFNFIQFCMGRTKWDKMYAKSLKNEINYFHVEEVLRPAFYSDNIQWEIKKRKEIKLISVLSPSIYKGFDLILKTAIILKNNNINFKWLVCGTSPQNSIIKALEKILDNKFSQQNVYFLGKKNVDELIPLLMDSDIFIHPSYIENSPNSICEAQILGMPVIATYVGGIPSLIENEKSGILVPANDPYFLSSTILSLLNEPDKMIHIGTNARLIAKNRHNTKNILDTLENTYKKILSIE